MHDSEARTPDLADSLAEGIAAVIAAGEDISTPEDLADLFLEELNRLWVEAAPDTAAPTLG